jgi:hypothetical protein
MGSKQGEHIFNALGDLAQEMVSFLNGKINKNAPPDTRFAASAAVDRLRERASELIDERNDGDFRTATSGDPANSYRYGQFYRDTKGAVDMIVSGDPSLHTRGYTILNRLLDDLDRCTIDQKAHDSAQDALSGVRQQQFNRWFGSTKKKMKSTFEALRDAALAVNRTLIG